MGTTKTLPAVILEKTDKVVGATSGLGYEHEEITYQGNSIIRTTKVKLHRNEGQDQIKIAVEVLDGQQVLSFRLACMMHEDDPPTFSLLEAVTDAAKEIAQIERFAKHRKGYHWTVFVGDYPDATKKHFRSKLELTQMAKPDEQFLRILVTYLPNTWDATRSFPLESKTFPPHPPTAAPRREGARA